MSEEEFRAAMADALDELPDDFLALLERDNVQVLYREWPTLDEVRSCGTLPMAYYLRNGPLYPDRPITFMSIAAAPTICVFHGFFEALPQRGDAAAVREAIRRVLVHEIAHHFNIPHERMKELGYA